MQIECHAGLTYIQRQEWNTFLQDARHQHPRQDPRFAAVIRADGWEVLHVFGREGYKICAVGLFSLRPHPFLQGAFAEAMCLSGPVCDDPQDLSSFLNTALRHPAFARIGRVKVTPYWMAEDAQKMDAVLADQGWSISESETFRRTGWVDLGPAAEKLLAAFSKSARREVRRAERQEITIHQIRDAEAALEFLGSLNRLRTRRGMTPIEQAGFLTSFSDIYRNGNTGVILAAHHGNTFIAGLLLYRGKFIAHGRHFTTETDILRTLGNLRISPTLWFEGMKWARSNDCTYLDVEGYREGSDTSDNKYNIYKYKSEFRPKCIIRISERTKITNFLINLTGNGKSILRAVVKSMLKQKIFGR